MPQKPQRPFVPHRTPNTSRPASSASEFRLYTPFIPGSERQIAESMAPGDSVGMVEGQSNLSVSLRPIEDFLDMSPPAAPGYAQDASDNSYASEFEDEPDELPPVEHFIDPLPVVDRFAPDSGGALSGGGPAAIGELAPTGAHPSDASESGWIETDWQHYDWRAAAALGESAGDEASNAWAKTDWDGTVPRARNLQQTAAHAIATALDEIAQRIRDGELAVPGAGAVTNSATIAATLAALLGVRR